MVSRIVASVWCKPTRAAGVRRVLQQWGVRRVALHTTVVRVAAAGRASLLGATLLRLEPSSRGSSLCNWVRALVGAQSSLTLCAARDQRVPAGKSGRSLRLGAPSLLLIEGAARCRRRARLTYTVRRVCDPNLGYWVALKEWEQQMLGADAPVEAGDAAAAPALGHEHSTRSEASATGADLPADAELSVAVRKRGRARSSSSDCSASPSSAGPPSLAKAPRG